MTQIQKTIVMFRNDREEKIKFLYGAVDKKNKDFNRIFCVEKNRNEIDIK